MELTFLLIVDFYPVIRLVLSRLSVMALINFCEQLSCTLNVIKGEVEPFGQVIVIFFIEIKHASGQKSAPDRLHI